MREMFGRIAPRYDIFSRVFSYGLDRRWKRHSFEKIALPDGALVLDLACGTGDFSKLVLERFPKVRVFAADLTEPMLNRARFRGIPNVICANASALPFADGCFDCVFIGYALRSFANLTATVREVERVIRPGGVFVALDFFLPANRFLRLVYLAYLYTMCAFWGVVLHGRPRIFTYIPNSLRSFVSVEHFSQLLRDAGYGCVEARPYILGGIGLHWARK